MKFMYLEYIGIFLLGFPVFVWLFYRVEGDFFQWVEDHWFYKKSFFFKLSSLFFVVGTGLLLLALMDLRGPEKFVTSKVSDQRTIILIDSSASMSVEDVRPSRFKKAVLLAKHYSKKAVGQKISVVVFSDMQKRIIPFTQDRDLLEARLSSLENLELNRGGTGLSRAIGESIQYFRNNSKDLYGNILIFTDAEETDGYFKMEVPDEVSVAVVGVGTAKGGPVPLRDRRNNFIGHKKFQGKTVTSRLDENFIKKLGKDIKYFKYWIAGSYSVPTEKILSFFSRLHKLKTSKNSMRIRPVLTSYLMVPGMIFLALSFILKIFPSLKYIGMIFLFLGLGQESFANMTKKMQEKPKEKSELIKSLEERFGDNDLSKQEKKRLAFEFLKEGFAKESKTLYQEVLKDDKSAESFPDRFNQSVAQFQSGDMAGGIKTSMDLLKLLDSAQGDKIEDLKEKVRQNLSLALKNQQQQQKQKQKEQDKKDQEKKDQNKKDQNKKDQNKKDQNKKDQQKKQQNQDQKDQKNKNQQQNQQKDQQQNKDQQKDKKDDQQDSKDQENKDQKNEDKNDQNKKQKKQEDSKEQPQNKRPKKLPALLKQLVQDDNQLQKKMIDAETKERKTREQKDW